MNYRRIMVFAAHPDDELAGERGERPGDAAVLVHGEDGVEGVSGDLMVA